MKVNEVMETQHTLSFMESLESWNVHDIYSYGSGSLIVINSRVSYIL